METVLELAAVVFTVMQFLSGITICMTIRRKRDTNETSAFPFLAGLISCSLWLKYGILQRDSTLMIVNSIGLTLQILYVIFYYWHSSVKTQIKRFVNCQSDMWLTGVWCRSHILCITISQFGGSL